MTFQHKKFLFILSLLPLMSLAQGASSPFSAGPYLGAAIGYGVIDTDSGRVQNVLNVDSKVGGLAGHVNAGYLWSLNPNFLIGSDVGYTLYPETRFNITDGVTGSGVNKASSLELSAIAKYLISHWSVSVRAGLAISFQNIDQTVTLPGGRNVHNVINTTRYLPLVGVGMGYAIPKFPGLIATLDFQYVFGTPLISDLNTTPLSAQPPARSPLYALLAGVTYSFG